MHEFHSFPFCFFLKLTRQVEHPCLLAKRQREAKHGAVESLHMDEVRDFQDEEPRKAPWIRGSPRASESLSEERRHSLESQQKAPQEAL